MTTRCFFSLEPPLEIRDKISSWIETSMPGVPGLKWVKRDALHITLKFCGQIEEKTIRNVKDKFKTAVDRESLKPFVVQLSGLGVFPNTKKASVLWVGVSKGQPFLERIFSLIERSISDEGIPVEKRPFHPHITVARARRGSFIPMSLVQKCLESSSIFGEWEASRIRMMKSDLYPEGPVYTPLASFILS